MAEFTVSGERNGKHVRITWRDGVVSGDDAASMATAEWVTQLAAMLDGQTVRLPGTRSTSTDHLSSPYSAYALIRSVFPGKTTLDRSLPKLGDIPPGAIS